MTYSYGKSANKPMYFCTLISLYADHCLDSMISLVSLHPKGIKTLATVKHVLSSHSKINKTKILETGGSLMQVESIAEWERIQQ